MTLAPEEISLLTGNAAPTEFVDLESFFGMKNKFVLRMRGDTMAGDHISDGDFIVCEQTNAARSGDLVIAVIDGKTSTIRKYFVQRGTVYLVPSNGDPREQFTPDRVRIIGVVVGVVRRIGAE